jgi:hypothetical protein
MGVFASEKEIPKVATDLGLVAADLVEHFKKQSFEAISEQTLTGGWHISIRKGGIFKAVLGLKTALNIEIESLEMATRVKASIGIFGQQLIPSVIMLFFAWPVLLTQIWGLVRQAKLDDEAIACVEQSLLRHSATPNTINAQPQAKQSKFCSNCGHQLSSLAACPNCGQIPARA